MTIITFICILIIAGFLSGDAATYWMLWVALFGGFIILSFIHDAIFPLGKTPNGFIGREERRESFVRSLKEKCDNGDIDAKRKLAWLNLSADERWVISETYKSLKRDRLNKTLQSCNDSSKCYELQEEINNLDWTYNHSRPPIEWIEENNL